MTSIQFIILALVLYTVGALLSLIFTASPEISRKVAAICSLLASVSGCISVILFMTETAIPNLTLFTIQPFGKFTLQMDYLSTLLVAIISLVGIATSLYSYRDAPAKISICFFTNIFMAAMLLVVTITNAFFFLIFWELMTLASYFLVVWEIDKKESARTGFIYMLVAHTGAALIMVAFFLFYGRAGTMDFAGIRSADLPMAVKNIAFVLAFLGFGAKAGMVPLHFWTPDTYAAAPHHVSALMSSVMKKTAVYGILRICVDLLGGSVTWWGYTILVFGVLSAVFGAFYALSEHDIKRLLALSSVENVGIILMGVGTGMLGIALQLPTLAVLGFLAALYHMLNHAFFKGLLFLGAGTVITQTGTRNLNLMGGLSRRMPWTAITFLIGALAVSAIPPLNGFISEWFTYQALLEGAGTTHFLLRVFAPLFAILLALAGALALMVYVKAYGGAFAGPARSKEATSASDPSNTSLFSLAYLALGTIILGIGAPWIAPRIAEVAADFTNLPLMAVGSGWTVYPSNPLVSVVSPPLVVILLLGLLIVPVILVAYYKGWQVSRRNNVEPWSNGYGYTEPMSVRASNFDQPVKDSFQALYWLRTVLVKPYQAITNIYHSTNDAIHRAEPVIESRLTRPTLKFVETAGRWIQSLQMGDIRMYCLYIIITLAVLLIAVFGRRGL
jgi:hydrogenase-4 component B